MQHITTGLAVFSPGGVNGDPDYCSGCRYLRALHAPGTLHCPDPHTLQQAPPAPTIQIPQDQGWLVPFTVGSLWAATTFMGLAAMAVATAIFVTKDEKDRRY